MFMSGVWQLDFDSEMVTGLCYTHDPNFAYLSSAEAEKSYRTGGWLVAGWLAGWVLNLETAQA